MKNPEIQRMVHEKLEAMVEPSLAVFAEGLGATKRRAFMTKEGEICYAAPELDHRVRTETAARILDRYERTCADHAGAADLEMDVIAQRHEEVLTPKGAQAEGAAHGIDVDQLNPTDRALVQQLAKIDQELTEIDGEVQGGEQKNGSEQ